MQDQDFFFFTFSVLLCPADLYQLKMSGFESNWNPVLPVVRGCNLQELRGVLYGNDTKGLDKGRGREL